MSVDAMHSQYFAYPLFLDVRGRRVVVVGGGSVAVRKIETLLAHGADVRVIAIDADERIRALAASGEIVFEQRAWAPGDFEGATLAFCACGDQSVEDAMCADAERAGCLVNVVDAPQRCDFTVPSLVARGPLRIAVSTSGASPLEARKIRETLEGVFDESWAAYLELLGQVRALAKDRITSEAERKAVFEEASEAGLRERIAAGDSIDAETVFVDACSKAKVEL